METTSMEATDTRDLESAWALLRRLARDPQAGGRASLARIPAAAHAQVRELLEIFLPICGAEASSAFVVAHLGQSLDGRIATRTGASQFITGHADVVHTHRLRALFDAVVVGASTVLFDDPRLTTRLVTGDHPVRVILDPQRRLAPTHGVFRDGLSPTLLVTTPDQARAAPRAVGDAEVVAVETTGGRFVVHALLATLRARGLGRVFVEGGGVTVSEFLQAQLLDRLHLTVAPVILGSGVPVLELPGIDHLSEALRLTARHFSLGSDVLFDCDMRASWARNDQ